MWAGDLVAEIDEATEKGVYGAMLVMYSYVIEQKNYSLGCCIVSGYRLNSDLKWT